MSRGAIAWVPPDHENRLAEFRTNTNMTITALAEKVGVSPTTLRAAELGTTSPLLQNGHTRPWVSKACDELGRLIEDVFPNHFCAWRPDELVPEQIYGDIMRRESPDIEDVIDARNAIRALYKRNKKSALAVWMMCCDYGLDEVAHVLGVSRSRAGQIEANGMRIIRQSFANKEKGHRDVVSLRTPGNEENKFAGPKGVPVNEWTHMRVRWRPEPVSEELPDKRAGMIWSERALWVRGGKVGPEPK